MKDFLLLSNINAITYKEFFPLLKNNKARAGYVFNKTLEFETPEGETKKQTGICWYTTFPVIHKHLVLTKKYNHNNYPHYDNYNAIEVGKVKDIPYDYDCVMGVPITIFGYDLDNVEIEQLCASHGKTPRGIENENCYLNGEWKYPRVLIKKNFEIEGLSASAGYDPDIVGIPLTKPGDARCLVDSKNKYARILIKTTNPKRPKTNETPPRERE